MSEKSWKWMVFPLQKPELNDLVWVLNPQLTEVLSYYRGFSSGFPIYIGKEKTIINFHVKFWRPSSEEDKLLMNWSPDRKEKKTKKSKN